MTFHEIVILPLLLCLLFNILEGSLDAEGSLLQQSCYISLFYPYLTIHLIFLSGLRQKDEWHSFRHTAL